ncbi:speckle-type POZ protein-like A [Trichogramma pretiosum]|uniref:speckle-type POZ protein-like A n=1 Tax=Trichogramma pretiosum TaxID=7493 RepID=UPI000C719103|nr:speckle-type POZ protein-like A [Trichogramma pretiosum]
MASTQRINATTTAVMDKCIYTWTIENYHVIKTKVGEFILSPKFSVGSDSKKYFQLKLYPAGDLEESAGFNSIFLHYLKTDSTKKLDKLVCKTEISAINNEKVVKKITIHEDYAESSWGWSKFYDLKNIDKLISSKNTVTIQCELEVFKEYESSLDSKTTNNEDEAIYGMKFNSAFLCEELSDIKLITSDDNSIPAHKIILATASPVFRTMFTSEMLQSKKHNSARKQNTIEMTDTPYNILIEMLRYIYTGNIVSTKTDVVLEILGVANKYEINNLKVKCGNILSAALSTENAIKILIAAHKCNVKHLENEVLKFVTAHKQSFLNSDKLLNVIQSMTNSLQ